VQEGFGECAPTKTSSAIRGFDEDAVLLGNVSMTSFVRYTALVLGMLFLSAAGLAWFDVLTHENVLTNPELKIASGWLMTGLMLLALGMRGWRRRRERTAASGTATERKPSG
jgi:hypothetical protein